MGLLPDMQNCGLRMRRECRERFPRQRGLATPTCITARASTRCFLWSRWWRKRSRHYRRMRNPLFYVSGKRPMGLPVSWLPSSSSWNILFSPKALDWPIYNTHLKQCLWGWQTEKHNLWGRLPDRGLVWQRACCSLTWFLSVPGSRQLLCSWLQSARIYGLDTPNIFRAIIRIRSLLLIWLIFNPL